jgi:hypothetical protein
MKTLTLLLLALPAFAGYKWQLPRVIDHTKVGPVDQPDLTFPVVVSDPRFKSAANSGSVFNLVTCGANSTVCPADLIFSSTACSAPTAMSWHFETYSPTTGALTAKVKVASASHTVDTPYWICVGNAAITTFQGGSTGSEFDSSTVLQYGLPNGSVLGLGDASGHGLDATNHGTSATDGKLDGAANFAAASSQYVASPIIVGRTGFLSGTACVWAFSYNAHDDGLKHILFGQLDSGTGEELVAMKWDNDNLYFGWRTSAGGDRRVVLQATAANFPQNAWTHYCLAWTDGGSSTVYVNGAAIGSNTLTPVSTNPGTNTLLLGSEPGSGAYWDGKLDEFQVSSVNRSGDWILAQYNSQSNPASFSTGTTWESLSAVPPPGSTLNVKTEGLVF